MQRELSFHPCLAGSRLYVPTANFALVCCPLLAVPLNQLEGRFSLISPISFFLEAVLDIHGSIAAIFVVLIALFFANVEGAIERSTSGSSVYEPLTRKCHGVSAFKSDGSEESGIIGQASIRTKIVFISS